MGGIESGGRVPWVALASRLEDGRLGVYCPIVGFWRDAPRPGALLAPGQQIGLLEVLGVAAPAVLPGEVAGVVVGLPEGSVRARYPLDHGALMLLVDPRALPGEAAGTGDAAAAVESRAGLEFRAPSSGRFYCRPAPDQPPFVSEGSEIRTGQTVCLLEIMKTFHRVVYGGPGLPERARVLAVVPRDQSDLGAGEVILRLEPLA
jgi:acetyl-CoA carboxylase biotin carboxyl carrier protein